MALIGYNKTILTYIAQQVTAPKLFVINNKPQTYVVKIRNRLQDTFGTHVFSVHAILGHECRIIKRIILGFSTQHSLISDYKLFVWGEIYVYCTITSVISYQSCQTDFIELDVNA